MGSIRRSKWQAWQLAVGPLLLGCTLVDEPIVQQDCTAQGQKLFVEAVMREHYLWYDRIPDVDPDDYETPEQLLDALAYRDLDRWTSMEPAAPRQTFFEEGKLIGLGYVLLFDQDEHVRIALSFEDSPAGRAGLERGTRVLAINGQTIEDIVALNLWATIDGEPEIGVPVRLRVQTLDGAEEELVLEKDWVQIDTVHTTRVLDSAAGKVGYLLFVSFLGTSVRELRQAFRELKAQQVEHLVLDLRYNGGGLVSTSQVLGSLIAGAELEDQILVQPTHNDRHPERDSEVLLGNEPQALNLDALTVITGPNTASASELVINGLRPFMPVELVGEQTYGKPVGAETWLYCQQAISPITFISLNAEGEADYFDGLPPRCIAPDDMDRALGDPAETRLSVALHWLENEACLEVSDESAATADAGRSVKATGPRAAPRTLGGRTVTEPLRRPWGLF